jgi:hypothetical protein
MSQTAAFDATEQHETSAGTTRGLAVEELRQSLKPTYRHGDGSAEVLSIDLLGTNLAPLDGVETGESMLVRIRMLFHQYRENPVCGFLIRNRLGIHVYGTNTELQQIDLGPASPGDVIEVTFSFQAWLAPDTFSISVAVHSPDNISFDWLDGVRFFRVNGIDVGEGIANLNAAVSHRRLTAGACETEPLEVEEAATTIF